MISVQIGGNVGFLSTLSLRRATAASITPTASRRNFYPRSPCGERPTLPGKAVTTRGFLSTLSLRRATAIHNAKINKHNNFYPRSPCGERQVSESIGTLRTVISIHALLAESDQAQSLKVAPLCISIHALLAESDSADIDGAAAILGFLSTLSLRRATQLARATM